MATHPRARRPGAPGYLVKYCEEVVEFMGRGYSLTAFAGEIGASRATLTAWCESHPNFADAVACAQARRARVLEDRLLNARGASAFGAHMQALKTAAPDEWPTGSSSTRSRPGAVGKAAPDAEASFEAPDNGRD